LSWRNTFGGGAPTSLILDVSGDASASLPLPLSESFTFPSVPPGSYRFSVRALNAAGSSGTSNSVTLTFPTNCSGSPSTPVNFIASKAGNVISLNWQPAASGAATLSYTINVSGAFNGSVPTPARSISSPVPAGTYNFSIRAVNPCGTSSATPVQSVTIP
jgi:predicted phage tail protein